nr:zinc finger protein CONSTANS-LIKE 4-like [Ipomoea batatas]
MAAVFCGSDTTFLCLVCDAKIHATNKLVSRHVRIWNSEEAKVASWLLPTPNNAKGVDLEGSDPRGSAPLAWKGWLWYPARIFCQSQPAEPCRPEFMGSGWTTLRSTLAPGLTLPRLVRPSQTIEIIIEDDVLIVKIIMSPFILKFPPNRENRVGAWILLTESTRVARKVGTSTRATLRLPPSEATPNSKATSHRGHPETISLAEVPKKPPPAKATSHQGHQSHLS